MTKKQIKRNYNIFVIAFVVLNVLATFIITTEKLNRYIISFNYTLTGIVNSVIGNVLFLLIVLFLVFAIVKKPKNRMLTLIGVTFFLNTALFAINIFNRYYGTSFTFKALAIFKNPGDGFGMTLVWEALRELITYYRVILYIPFMALLGYYTVLRTKGIKSLEVPSVSFKGVISRAMMIMLLFFVNISFFISRSANINIINSSKATYATQNLGLYSYLVLDAMGFDYSNVNLEYDDAKDILDSFNKNQESYKSSIDGKTYTNSPLISDVNNINGKLLNGYSNNDQLTGILEDYNLVLVHLESFNNFLLQIPEVAKHFINLQALLEQSYVFSNFYSNVGLGNSFDAELTVMSGLMPNGTSTIAWDYNSEIEEKNFDYLTLPKLFKKYNRNYLTTSYHGNRGDFYNRNIVHPGLFGLDEYKDREKILEQTGLTLEEVQEKYDHISNLWISDRGMLDFLNQEIDNNYSNNEQFMKFLITLMPHTPYHYDPYFPTDEDAINTSLYDEDLVSKLDIVALRYINYAKYYDEFFRILFEDFTDYGNKTYDSNNLYERKKTAYVFYGDHGSGLKAKDLNILTNEELTPMQHRRMLSNTLSFIYVPGEEVVTKTYDDGTQVSFREGLLKGEQTLVRNQLDLYRTIIDLFNLPMAKEDYLFGVHGMSTEPTYSLDNKSLDYVTDTYIGTVKDLNLAKTINNELFDSRLVTKIGNDLVRFKKYSDLAMDKNLYKMFKSKVKN
ncbi:MAG TPA: sulfatase-like hydrolase/transferase [Haploplasma sp.]|nr:sulfatase-like hydrolase/transferase [Haploplasma sp.]